MKKLILKRGKSCEECVFFDALGKGEECKNHVNKRCGEKLFFGYESVEGDNNNNYETVLGFSKCEVCSYYSCITGYKPHCHYNGTKKSPIIDDNFKCPKEIKE